MSRVTTWMAALAVSLMALAGCKTESFCFENCDPFAATGGSGGGGGRYTGGMGGNFNFAGTGPDGGRCVGFNCQGQGGAGSQCVPTNEGVEVCDQVDNDCDGQTDNGIDFTSVRSCGSCDLDCTLTLTRVATPSCLPAEGATPARCDFDNCAPDWFDADGNPGNGCEYFCQWNPDRANTTDPGGAEGCGRDDDCDGEIDEDIDVCGDVENCGECGKRCSLPNATATCVTDAAQGEECTTGNTRCDVATCATGFFDVDGNAGNGCEYECTLTNGGAEACDGEDNDCDGLIDNADPDLESDPAIGVPCYGSDKGACAASSVAGVQKCIAGAVTCCDVDSNTKDSLNDPRLPSASVRNGVCEGTVGPFVLFPDEQVETCNGIDDDCDGQIDDTPTDAGGVCGSNVGECQTGLEQCVSGALTCVGNIGPTTDTCDGLDNDCDGVIDGVRVPGGGAACSTNANCASQGRNGLCLPVFTNNNLRECVARPTDTANASGGAKACDVPPSPPSGVPQPCSAGTLSCFGGVPTCVGSVKAAPGTIDACGEDTNCDGLLTNQVGRLDDDVKNCGSCGNDCTAAFGNANWICANGSCTSSGCEPGYVECTGPPNSDCETACSPDPGGELCDGIDNDCDCQTDEGIPPPTVYQACGVNPAATDLGCTDQVSISCSAGGWICTFPSGYCPGGNCAAAVERCDGKDNDCDGEIDENFQPPLLTSGFLGASCKSDDGLPPPGHGDCQTTGVYVCAANQLGTTCAAQIDLTRATPELCDGVDNDCDGLVDAADPSMTGADGRLGQSCQGGTLGVCAAPGNAGLTQCAANGSVVCNGPNVIRPGTVSEVCNNVDDDCDGSTDEVSDLIDDGGSCGTGVGACVSGTWQCQTGSLVCIGGVGPGTETCNGIDDDCDGTPDNNLTLGTCNVPPPAPGGATQPCSPGTYQCQSGALVCSGSVTAQSPVDLCGDDTNCDGQLSNQPDTQTDPRNCGSCGFDCAAQNAGAHGTWSCVAGACQRTGCEFGYINCDGNAGDCENYCPFQSGAEICNGLDDDCDCATDEDIPAGQTPSPISVCGVAPGATQAECQPGNGTTGVGVTCSAGTWSCQFPSGFCTTVDPTTGKPSCALTPEQCNNIDDNCNGAVDEDFKAPVRSTKILNSACSSEDVYRDLQCATSGNLACPPSAPPHGVCAGTGVYTCSGLTDTVCTATFIDGNRSDELCDALDNDCDGLVDETFNTPGGDARYVSPDVVQVGASLWVYQYEASRPKATTTSPGNGNGYWCTGGSCSGVPPAPAGKPLQKTPACSMPGVLPWFNVTPVEVEQTCQAMGGFICDQSVWNAACEAQGNCTYAYGPRASCNSASAPPARVCNIHAFDFDGNGANGLTDGLLPTASGALADCYADWDGLLGNVSPGGRLFDFMGNLREITQLNSTTYTLMGGAFNTTVEGGANCDFDFFAVTQSFQLFDTGFRCCFNQDPR